MYIYLYIGKLERSHYVDVELGVEQKLRFSRPIVYVPSHCVHYTSPTLISTEK